MSQFPQLRLRRLRATPATRSLLAEARVHPHDLIAPLFVVEGKGVRQAIGSLPGQFHLSVDKAMAEAGALLKLGIPGIMLFGIPDAKAKSDDARAAWAKDGIVQRAVRAIKKAVPPAAGFHRRLRLRVHQPRPLRPGGSEAQGRQARAGHR